MQPRRIATIVIAFGGLGLGCLSLLVGCGDDSRTTGQVEMSPQTKEGLQDIASAMETERKERKQAWTAQKKKR